MIRGYPRDPSVLPGEVLSLHVSTDRPAFRVEFYRVGKGLVRMPIRGASKFQGQHYPDGPADRDWGWPAYEFSIPEDWPSGCYVAVLIAIDAGGSESSPSLETADGVDSKALFIVRSREPGSRSRILYKVAWNTFHAYNATGYGSLYQEAVWVRDGPRPGFKVTTRRPGGGTGGVVMMGDSADYYDLTSRRQTFAHWDQPFIGWLESNDYRVDYCTDLDLHREEHTLDPYNLMLSVGHDEYWSGPIRSRIDAFIDRGGNVAFFSGNIDGWRIHLEDFDTAIVCAKAASPGGAQATASASANQPARDWEHDSNQSTNPENRTTGVSYYRAGGWWDGKRETLGYTVQHSGHWAYAGTGLSDGDTFGDDDAMPLIGYECDGAAYGMRDGYAFPTGVDGTPGNFFILGLARLGPGWRTYSSDAVATMGSYTSDAGGIVFQGATTDWPKVVSRNREVETITRNVLDRLSLNSVRVLGPLPGHYGRLLAERGKAADFVVDVTRFEAPSRPAYRWQISGGSPVTTESPRVELLIPDDAKAVTVTVEVLDSGRPVGFGSTTFAPMSEVDSLRLEIVMLLREMSMPGDPSGSLVAATSDPLTASRAIVTINLPGLADRSVRLAEVSRQLLEIWSRDGSRPVVADPRAAGATGV